MWFFGWSKFIGNSPAEGLILAEEALKLAPGVWEPGHIDRMQCAHTLAWIYSALGRHEEATRMFEEALRHAQRPDVEKLALTDVAALGACYRATNRVAEAQALLTEKVAALEKRGVGRIPPQIAHLRCQLGLTLLREGRFEEAESVLRQALLDYKNPKIPALQKRLHPPPRAASGLGQALAAQGKFPEAEKLVVEAFEELQAGEGRIAGNRSAIVREAFDAVIALYSAWGKTERVAEWKAKRGETSSKPAPPRKI
jgi:tetratricopeptide (TPR) repeat protein